jgi:hypothetical protein
MGAALRNAGLQLALQQCWAQPSAGPTGNLRHSMLPSQQRFAGPSWRRGPHGRPNQDQGELHNLPHSSSAVEPHSIDVASAPQLKLGQEWRESTGACTQGAQGSVAVKTEGSGGLRGVRIINLLRDTLFWFQVDSGMPAPLWSLPVPEQAQGLVKAEVRARLLLLINTPLSGLVVVLPPKKQWFRGGWQECGCGYVHMQVPAKDAVLPIQPSWASSPASPSVAVLEQRAKAWHLAHHLDRTSLEASRSGQDHPASKRRRTS